MIKMKTEKINFENSKGQKLVGVLHLPKEKTDKIVILAHGSCSNKDRERLVKAGEAYAKNRIDALRFDFGGSGESYNTKIIIENQVDDLKSAIKFVKDKNYKNVGLQGESLGGLISLLAYNKEIKAMVLLAPVTKSKIPSIIKKEEFKQELNEKGYITYKKDNRKFIIPEKYFQERSEVNQKQLLSRIDCPVMIIHGNKDSTVPLEHSKEAIEILRDAKLEIIKGGTHSLKEKTKEIIPILVNWFNTHLK